MITLFALVSCTKTKLDCGDLLAQYAQKPEALESYVEDGRTHQAHTINKKATSASVHSLLHDTLFDWTEWNDLDPEEQEDLIEAGDLPVDYAVLDSKKLLNQLLEGKLVFK